MVNEQQKKMQRTDGLQRAYAVYFLDIFMASHNGRPLAPPHLNNHRKYSYKETRQGNMVAYRKM